VGGNGDGDDDATRRAGPARGPDDVDARIADVALRAYDRDDSYIYRIRSSNNAILGWSRENFSGIPRDML
jgi:hypothetical protein